MKPAVTSNGPKASCSSVTIHWQNPVEIGISKLNGGIFKHIFITETAPTTDLKPTSSAAAKLSPCERMTL